MKKRLVSLLLVFCTLLSVFPFSALAADDTVAALNPFGDVAANAWYRDDVVYVYANRLFVGVSDTEFNPGGEMSRGMFVTVLGRLAGVDPENYRGTGAFSDVDPDAYYAPYIAWADQYGITSGTGDGLFSPDEALTRQQLAVFFIRYFETFSVDYGAENAAKDSFPADLDQAEDWAKDAILKLWRAGLLNGDGVNFAPGSSATRAEAAAICRRADLAVRTWYSEPGVPSTRIPTDPFATPSVPDPVNYYTVTFYDGERWIDTLYTPKNEPLGHIPTVEKSSKKGAILLGYYTDPEFREPFYAESPVTENMRVYARYQEMESSETLNFTIFTQMDQSPDLSFTIRRISGHVDPQEAAVLTVKDGTAPVRLEFTEDGALVTVRAKNGFNEGSSYELTLADGWIFDGKPETIRTASFSIFKEEVENLQMSGNIKYLLDTDEINYTIDGALHPVLTSALLTQNGGSFPYSGEQTLAEGDLLCIYVGVHPLERSTKNAAQLLDPAVYVKIKTVSGNTVSFLPLGEEDQASLYEIPDNFPLLVAVLPVQSTGTVMLPQLDISMYENMMGKTDGTLDYARSHIGVGDFVTLYVGAITSEEDLYFGRITAYDAVTGSITYQQVTRQDILDSMDLYSGIDLTGKDLLSPEEQQEILENVQTGLENSDFADQAARLLAGMIVSTDAFRKDPILEKALASHSKVSLLSASPVAQSREEMTLDRSSLQLKVRFLTDGSELHFRGGIQLAVDVRAKFNTPIDNSLGSTLTIDLSASFVQEIAVKPTVRASLVTKKILFIPIPIGVHVGASLDVKNYTALSFDAEITTHDNSGILYSTEIASDLMDIMSVSENTGLSQDYRDSLQALMQKYSEMLSQETDWITLVEEEMFDAGINIYAIGIGVKGSFLVNADMSIAIGSNLEYEVGKRYSFWFEIGLFKPTTGSSTMDLLDERFAFQFYVMGKLGIKTGVKLSFYVGIGGGKVASVAISTELGPYIKLYGFFIYEVSKYRPQNTNNWDYQEQMAGALFLEFGLYFKLSFEASALSLFEYSYDFVDLEIPLLTAGDPRYYYGFCYKANAAEAIVVRDEDSNTENGITMTLPDSARALMYMTLNTGIQGSNILSPDQYHYTLSNPNFTFYPETGEISVTVPGDTHFLMCSLVITYLNGKMAFSDYDMSVSIPLIWTDLSEQEINEYFTASVRVGNDTDGYETVWSKRVLRGQPFDLPSAAEINALIRYTGTGDVRYRTVDGYAPDQQLEELTIYTDTVYDYTAERRTYSLTVNGIQEKDGTTRSETFTAKYGGKFDFSSLQNTGTDIPGVAYTKFTVVTADGDALDLSRPINGAMAQQLATGVTATANYVDDSTTAVFLFSGVTLDDRRVKIRKGTMPDTSEIASAVEALGDEGIREIVPLLGEIDEITNFVVICVTLSGQRADVSFDRNDNGEGVPPTPLDKLVGGLIVNLPVIERPGYTFNGWFTAPVGGERAETQTVPEDGITLYAHWTPNKYTVGFHLNGGDGDAPDSLLLTFDSPYGELPTVRKTGKRFTGWWTEAEGGMLVTEETLVKIPADHTLYAHWAEPIRIDPAWLIFGETETFTYEKGVTRAAIYALNRDDPAMVGEDNIPFPADGFRLTYVPTQGGLGISTEKPVNAGTFKVRVTRPADDIYAAFEAEYEGVLKINKATRSAEELSLDESKTKTGHNFLVIGFNKIEDLHANAKTTISVSGGGTGLSLEKGRVLFSNLPANRRYSISIQITGDPNYEDFAQTLPETADLSTQAVPTSLPGASDVDKAWYNGSSNLYLSTAAQMFGFAELIRGGESFAGKTVTLLCDVDLGTFRWDTGNREFKGTFDGGGHAIYGISVSGAKANAGLFDLLGSGAVVRNVCLIGGSVFSNAGSLSYGHVGGIAGYALNGSTILSCTNYAAISGTGGGDNGGFGGIVGAVSYDQNGAGANVKNCVNYGSVSGSPYHIGGIVGYHLGTSTIANCANYGPVNGATCTGGIVGETYNASSVVYNCVNGGMVTGGGSYRGAIVGRNNENDGHVEQCYYLAGSAPGRSSSGSKDGAEPDIMENLKCSAFQSYTSIPALVVEEGCGGLPLLDVLNAWARRCGYVSWNWDANGYPVPESAPRG